MATDNSDVNKVELGAPPAYDNNTPPAYNNEPPPSYDSVFGRVQQMRDESDGNADFAKKMVGCMLCGTACSIVTIIIMLAIPIACIVFGAMYLGDCPIEPYIPIYLLVAGVFGLVKAILGIFQEICKRKSGDTEEEQGGPVKCLKIVDGPISCFLLTWFIAGSVWVYRNHGRVSSLPGSPLYCEPTLYTFAFWILTVQYIMLALAFCCVCLGFGIALCVGCKKAGES